MMILTFKIIVLGKEITGMGEVSGVKTTYTQEELDIAMSLHSGIKSVIEANKGDAVYEEAVIDNPHFQKPTN